VRTAVLSDIHANLEALEAVLAAADEHACERIVVLGDIVGYGADPNGVIERLAARGAISICGNHDLAATGRFDLTWFNDSAAAAIAWTTSELSADARSFLAALEPRRTTETELLVHGSVRDPAAEYLLSVKDARASFEMADFGVAFCGHTHLPTVFTLDPSGDMSGQVMTADAPVAIAPGVRYMLNPGSVGQPRDRDPRASFLVSEDGRTMLHRIPYAIELAQRKIRAAGLPPWLADRLASGE
jgi:predicted phosphodiesterase